MENENGSIISNPVENWIWMGLWTCHKTEHGMNEHAMI